MAGKCVTEIVSLCGNVTFFNDVLIPSQYETIFIFFYCSCYSNNQRIECKNYEMNPDNRQPELSKEASFLLRHIMFSFFLPLNTVVSLWADFCVLIMRKPLPKEYFSSMTTLWSHIMQLNLIDNMAASEKFQ